MMAAQGTEFSCNVAQSIKQLNLLCSFYDFLV